MPERCQDHPNVELTPAEDSGAPTCWVCVAVRLAELADSCGIIGPNGQEREDFVRNLLTQA